MKTSAAEIIREYGPFPGVENVHGLTLMTVQHVLVCVPETRLNALDPTKAGQSCARSMFPAHAGTAFDRPSICFRSPRDRIQKIDRKDRPRTRHDPGARRRRATPGSPGPKGRFWVGAVSGPQDPSKSIRKQGRYFATIESNRFVHRGSPGSTANSGTAPGEGGRERIEANRILERERFLQSLEAAARHGPVRARVRWWRSVVLRAAESSGKVRGRPPAPARPKRTRRSR